MRLVTIGVAVWLMLPLTGCVHHNVKYAPMLNCRFPAAPHASSIDGSFDRAKQLFEKAALPHNTVRQRCELVHQALSELRRQLGSDDYVLIGEVYGGGNAKATMETLKAALCKKAARKGGDVVMFFRTGYETRQYTVVQPGFATTNVYGSAYSSGNYTTGSATGYTTYSPRQAYSGVLYLPTANGLVFKYVPGTEARYKALMSLDDKTLETVSREIENLAKSKPKYDELVKTMDEIVERAKNKPSTN